MSQVQCNKMQFSDQRKNWSGQEVQIQECHWGKTELLLFPSSSSVNPYSCLLELHFDSFSQKCLRLPERMTRFFTFLCSVKISLWTVSPLERHRHNRWFSVQAPLAWNSLPPNVRHSCPLLQSKLSLKTFLFTSAFSELPWFPRRFEIFTPHRLLMFVCCWFVSESESDC